MLATTWLRRLALVAVLALAATACGGGTTDEPEDGATTPAEDDDDTETEDTARGDGTLRLGYILPETGDLAFLGPPMIEAVEMAVRDINEAGGVLGNDVTLEGADEAGDAAVASQAADRLLAANVDAIVGAAASGMSLAIIDKVTQAGVAQCSGSNTSPTFTGYPHDGYYFRTAPTDALQGPVLAETMVGDGHTTIALMARSDDYGQGLLEATAASLEEQGAEVVAEILYDPNASTFDAEVQQVITADPDAVALIAFNEGAQILQGLIEGGINPQDMGVYGSDGLRSNDLASQVDPNNPAVLEGMKGTAPDPGADPEFLSNLQEFAPDLEETIFAAQTYDCAIITALAAVAAGSDDPEVFKEEIVNVTRDGEACASFEECVELLEAGEDIDYNGASGPLEFTEDNEPETGSYEVWSIGADGTVETVTTVESRLS